MNRAMLRMAVAAIVAVLIATTAEAKKTQVIRAPGGTNIGQAGLSIDASYDPRFDNLVPGYKVIDVALVNQSFQIYYFDPEKDRWKIKLAGEGKPVTAIHDLRRVDPTAWAALPERAKPLLSYPLVLPIGARQVIDLFVPETVDVQQFNELEFYLKSIDTRFEILVRQ